MFIYKITNNVNGKVYIGQTINAVELRFKRHINDSKNNVLDTHFARAIRKYGENCFICEVIDTANTQDELNKKEQEWIRFYNSVESGYNETDAISKCGGNTYMSKSPDELKKISKKISVTKIGKLNPNSKSVKCLNVDNGEELFFDTVEDCRRYFGERTHRFITTRVNGNTRGLFKGVWAIAYIESDYTYNTEARHGMAVVVKDSNGNIRRFVSIREAARVLNVNRGGLQGLLKNGKTRSMELKGFECWFDCEGVTTNPDECKGVGDEIGTSSKRTATSYDVEDIVCTNGDIG